MRHLRLGFGIAVIIAVAISFVLVMVLWNREDRYFNQLSDSRPVVRSEAQQQLGKMLPAQVAEKLIQRLRKRPNKAESDCAVGLLLRFAPEGANVLEGPERELQASLEPLLTTLGRLEPVKQHIITLVQSGESKLRERGVLALRWCPPQWAIRHLIEALDVPPKGDARGAINVLCSLRRRGEIPADQFPVIQSKLDLLLTEDPEFIKSFYVNEIAGAAVLGSKVALRHLAEVVLAPDHKRGSEEECRTWFNSLTGLNLLSREDQRAWIERNYQQLSCDPRRGRFSIAPDNKTQ